MTVLRLLCIHSLTSGGLKQSSYNTLRTEVLQTYVIHCVIRCATHCVIHCAADRGGDGSHPNPPQQRMGFYDK